MINKYKILCLVWFLNIANIVGASEPPRVPHQYDTGPKSALSSHTKLITVEKTIYALYEATMSASKHLIHATSCAAAAGGYKFSVATNGAVADPKNNEISIVSSEKTKDPLILRANISAPSTLRGQQIQIERFGNGSLGDTKIIRFESTVLFNTEGSIMTADSSAEIRGINGRNDSFQSKSIKNFYLDGGAGNKSVYGWGGQSLSKFGFPDENYWFRFKVERNDGVMERSIFISDRINGAGPCQIVVESTRVKDENKVLQKGSLIISTVLSNKSKLEFNLKPNT